MGNHNSDKDLPSIYFVGRALSLLSELLAELHEDLQNSLYEEESLLGHTERVEPEYMIVRPEAIHTGALFDAPIILFDYNRFYL